MHPRLARQVVFPLLQRKEGGRVLQLLEDLEKSQWHRPEQLQKTRWSRLNALLDHAYRTVPYYRTLFDTYGLHPREFTGLEDLGKLPTLTKEVVRDRGRELMSTRTEGPLVERRTSGSTGIPLAVHASPVACDAWVAASLRTFRWWGLDVGLRQLKLVNPHGKSRATLLKQHWLMNTDEYSVFELDAAALEKVYQRAVRFRCEVLFGYPSALTLFAQHVAGRGRRSELRLRAILTTAEVLYPDHRELLQRVFACPVINEYGSSECGYLAGECRWGHLHIAAENVLIEFERGATADGDDDDTASEMVVTDLTNFAMPLIRYRIGDLGAPGQECPCGRGLPALRLSVGRTEDVVTLPDGRKVDGSVFGTVIEELTRQGVAVKQFRAIQHRLDHIEVLVATDHTEHQALRQLSSRLQSALGARLTVVVRAVDHIPVEPSGKLRRFVSLLDARNGDQVSGATESLISSSRGA